MRLIRVECRRSASLRGSHTVYFGAAAAHAGTRVLWGRPGPRDRAGVRRRDLLLSPPTILRASRRRSLKTGMECPMRAFLALALTAGLTLAILATDVTTALAQK